MALWGRGVGEVNDVMNDDIRQALARQLLFWGDDELLLAHRNSEWIGYAPMLEEDIAIANIAQDELGHARVYYSLREGLTDEPPDEVVFFRGAADFVNVQLVELPRGDWAVTMVRQFLFDAYEYLLLPRLAESAYRPLADGAVKMRNEEIYHLRHSELWVRRLGGGTAESQRRMQVAVDALWPLAWQLFGVGEETAVLMEAGIVPEMDALEADWLELTTNHLRAAGLTIPERRVQLPMRHEHSEHLAALVGDLQMVARLDREAEW